MTKKSNGAPLKQGSLTDQEKRDIERWIDVKNYAEIARLLNRNPATIRKYCQRKGLANDITSKKKYTDNRAKHNHHLVAMREQLSKPEYEFAVQIYKGMMEQAGTDIVYSEEVQIIEYCTITCLLNRVLKREMDIAGEVETYKKQRAEWQKKKDDLANMPVKDDEDEEAEKYDMEEYYTDKIEQINLSIADLQVEYVQVKKDQKDFLDRKESITKALNGSREQRAKEITRVNQNFSDLIVFIKKNEDFRNNIGAEIEKMRLGIKEEYIRLSDLHVFGDGTEDYPVYNTEIAMRKDA